MVLDLFSFFISDVVLLPSVDFRLSGADILDH